MRAQKGGSKQRGARGVERSVSGSPLVDQGPPERHQATKKSRPTNNALLYKAHLRWDHYHAALSGKPHQPEETEPCASVTSAFLQVMNVLFTVESARADEPRNVLQVLSECTRRTKVVELSSGTHRVPDELRKHSLSDGEGGQYSTNLDRNRYGSDDQYLSTVVRYDLNYLQLCPCLVEIEIIDAKTGSGFIPMAGSPDICTCPHEHRGHAVRRTLPQRTGTKRSAQSMAGGPAPRGRAQQEGTPGGHPQGGHDPAAEVALLPPRGRPPVPQGTAHPTELSPLPPGVPLSTSSISPSPQTNSVSAAPQNDVLFEALVMAAGANEDASLENAVEAFTDDYKTVPISELLESPPRGGVSRGRPPAGRTPSGRTPAGRTPLGRARAPSTRSSGDRERPPSLRGRSARVAALQEREAEESGDSGELGGRGASEDGDQDYVEEGVRGAGARKRRRSALGPAVTPVRAGSASGTSTSSRAAKDGEITRLRAEVRSLVAAKADLEGRLAEVSAATPSSNTVGGGGGGGGASGGAGGSGGGLGGGLVGGVGGSGGRASHHIKSSPPLLTTEALTGDARLRLPTTLSPGMAKVLGLRVPDAGRADPLQCDHSPEVRGLRAEIVRLTEALVAAQSTAAALAQRADRAERDAARLQQAGQGAPGGSGPLGGSGRGSGERGAGQGAQPVDQDRYQQLVRELEVAKAAQQRVMAEKAALEARLLQGSLRRQAHSGNPLGVPLGAPQGGVGGFAAHAASLPPSSRAASLPSGPPAVSAPATAASAPGSLMTAAAPAHQDPHRQTSEPGPPGTTGASKPIIWVPAKHSGPLALPQLPPFSAALQQPQQQQQQQQQQPQQGPSPTTAAEQLKLPSPSSALGHPSSAFRRVSPPGDSKAGTPPGGAPQGAAEAADSAAQHVQQPKFPAAAEPPGGAPGGLEPFSPSPPSHPGSAGSVQSGAPLGSEQTREFDLRGHPLGAPGYPAAAAAAQGPPGGAPEGSQDAPLGQQRARPDSAESVSLALREAGVPLGAANAAAKDRRVGPGQVHIREEGGSAEREGAGGVAVKHEAAERHHGGHLLGPECGDGPAPTEPSTAKRGTRAGGLPPAVAAAGPSSEQPPPPVKAQEKGYSLRKRNSSGERDREPEGTQRAGVRAAPS